MDIQLNKIRQMDAEKFVKREEFDKDGVHYVQRTNELRKINISERDWEWIYEYIMYDDYDCAQSNGFYESESGYHSIDCQMVAEKMDEWLEELKDEYEETLEDKSDDFQADFKRIKKIMENNIGFTLYFSAKTNK